MIVKRHHGLVEMISSPAERQRDLISDHVLDLLTNIDGRLRALEERLKLPSDDGEIFREKHDLISDEIEKTRATYQKLLESGERPVAKPPREDPQPNEQKVRGCPRSILTPQK